MNPTTSLHPRLRGLPAVLLESLGRCQSAATLTQHFGVQEALMAALRHPHPPEVQHVHLHEHGLFLELVCCQADAAQEARLWGLRSFTLSAGQWHGAWPEGLDPAQISGADLVALLATDPAQALLSPSMSCFAVSGPENRVWSVLALFDPRSNRLQSLALVHLGEWRPARLTEPRPA